jgi:hypothetical protein
MATPKYTIKSINHKIIDVSDFTDDEVREIALDLNKKGFIVYIDGFGPNEDDENKFIFNGVLFEVYNGVISVYTDNDLTPERYLEDETTLYAYSITPEIKVAVKNIKPPTVIGVFNNKDVVATGDKITIGCQKSTKDEVVALAKTILKHYGVDNKRK